MKPNLSSILGQPPSPCSESVKNSDTIRVFFRVPGAGVQKAEEKNGDKRTITKKTASTSMDMLQRSHRVWVEESLRAAGSARDSKWSASIAVGSNRFVGIVKSVREQW